MIKLNSYDIWQGDSLDVLSKMPDECVNMAVTSPPYWGLRKYLDKGSVIIDPDLSKEKQEKIKKELKKRGVEPNG